MRATRGVRDHAVLLSATLVAALALGGCGDDSDTTATTPVGDTSAPGVPEAELDIDYRNEAAGLAFGYGLDCGDGGEVTGAGAEVAIEADAACAVLDDPVAVERLVQGPPEDQVCTEIYGGDDVVTIDGTIGSERVDARVDRADGCGISTWDDLLAPMLPEPVGVLDEGG